MKRKSRSMRDVLDSDWEKFNRLCDKRGTNQGHMFGELLNHKCN